MTNENNKTQKEKFETERYHLLRSHACDIAKKATLLMHDELEKIDTTTTNRNAIFFTIPAEILAGVVTIIAGEGKYEDVRKSMMDLAQTLLDEKKEIFDSEEFRTARQKVNN